MARREQDRHTCLIGLCRAAANFRASECNFRASECRAELVRAMPSAAEFSCKRVQFSCKRVQSRTCSGYAERSRKCQEIELAHIAERSRKSQREGQEKCVYMNQCQDKTNPSLVTGLRCKLYTRNPFDYSRLCELVLG